MRSEREREAEEQALRRTGAQWREDPAAGAEIDGERGRRRGTLRPEHAPQGFVVADRLVRDPIAERAQLVAELRATPAAIAPKYFYDELGCAIYAAICLLPEYYPTRTEAAIFDAYRADIAECVGRGTQLVDLGAGDAAKAERWIPHLQPRRYVAVDIARHAIEQALARLSERFDAVELAGVVTDFTSGLDLSGDLAPGPATFFYPGSSIGNFPPEEAVDFLRQVRQHCAGRPRSGLLIGVDARKAGARLEAAYDDALGVTASFNRNVLNHVNRVIGSRFDSRDFAHRALYDEARGRVEMHLEALRDVAVAIDGTRRVFSAGERIHTENSYKYAPAEFEDLIAVAGFASVRRWQDPAGDYAVYWAA